MTKVMVYFRNFAQITWSHFLSTFSQTQKLSITQVGNLVETGPLAVAVNWAGGKQRNKIFAICFESRVMEIELNREKQVIWWGKKTLYSNFTEFSTMLLLLLLLLLYLFPPLRTVFTIMYLKQTLFIRYTVLQLFCIYSLCYM
jgi:hypothetical protein